MINIHTNFDFNLYRFGIGSAPDARWIACKGYKDDGGAGNCLLPVLRKMHYVKFQIVKKITTSI